MALAKVINYEAHGLGRRRQQTQRRVSGTLAHSLESKLPSSPGLSHGGLLYWGLTPGPCAC